jgi:hypothetical protein
MLNPELEKYLKRIETKLSVFAEGMGISIDQDPDWLTVDDEARVIYIANMHRSLSVILKEAKRRGATKRNKVYDLIHRGDCVGTLLFH